MRRWAAGTPRSSPRAVLERHTGHPCQKCGQRPIRVALEEDAAATSKDRAGAYGWQAVLVERES
jgi:hypothetical protein